MTGRGFVLMPLADIAPAMEVEGRAVADWLKEADVAGIEPASAGPEWWRVT
jgi:2-amino-4-hydroxy-6-hydroxymethyldihydropteridine diphosphokinase